MVYYITLHTCAVARVVKGADLRSAGESLVGSIPTPHRYVIKFKIFNNNNKNGYITSVARSLLYSRNWHLL